MPDAATIEAYGAELMAYWKALGREDGLPWAQNTAGSYSRVYFSRTKPLAARQGFSVDK